MLKIKRLITLDLLFYSWNDIKANNKFVFDLTKKGISEPISKSWFKKAALFIQKGNYNYENTSMARLDKFYSQKNFLQVLKNKILENAFLLILKPSFREYFFKDFNLTECLRLPILFFILNDLKIYYKSNRFDSNLFKSLKNSQLKCFDYNDFNINFAFLSANVIKTWVGDIRYFLKFNLLKSFSTLNKNRMKNIFLKIFNDVFVWEEIEKMFNTNFLSISDDFLYCSRTNLGRSALSVLLFEIYIHQLDMFFFDFIRSFSFRRKIFSFDISNFNRKRDLLFPLKKILSFFFPVRLGVNISNFINIKNIVTIKYSRLNEYYLDNIFIYENFDKYVYYTRYLDSFLLGFVSNKGFVNFAQKKLLDFVRTNLHFEVKDVNVYFSIEKCILFLGYNIRLLRENKNFSFINIKKNKNFIYRSLSRLEYFTRKNSNLLYQRFSAEFAYNIDKFTRTNALISSSLKDKNVWTYLFQLEVIRSTQFDKLVLSYDKISLIPSEFVFCSESLQSSNYLIYRFNLYNLKVQVVLRDIFQSIPFRIKSSVLPFDLVLNNYFLELKKKVFFMYNNYFFDIDKNSELSFKFLAYKRFYSNLGNLNFYSEDLEFLKTSFSNRKKKRENISSCFSFFIPVDFLINKLRSLGYIHPNKLRPIGNSKYLHYSDEYIIKIFGLMAFSFLNWYKLCNDWKKLELIIGFIRESCFLTLCRKHNKSKCWAYSVYTPDLIISNNLFFMNSFFPTRNDISEIKLNLLNNNSNTIDEKFFINFN
uniref:putative group II intron reverse transcriptase/maturase mat2 n=1 Tax=Euglena undulata TaxID=1685799 RepID=UPI0023AA5B15|nr:putative group II intron reverse transcriptase/maturase mat2 [Euglena undulata]WCH63461.1 putative group II intron reverse transcriptase/maturase mat2 [Euglena undulata]